MKIPLINLVKERNLLKINKILQQVKLHKEFMRSLSDTELSNLTYKFKARLSSGETLDDLLPEAFAAMCEADFRVLGKFPYDVQIMGGIALHLCFLAEMNTGEGKTLTATLPLYLNALTGKSCFLVTTNDYLAARDAEEMSPAYEFMGISCRSGVNEESEERFTNEDKKLIYSADIVYTTHSAIGFDYLFNNLVKKPNDRFLRDLHYIIVDEADSVLLDSAQTPLVISGSPRVQSNLYDMSDFFVTTLEEGRDFEKDDDVVWFTNQGIKNAESYFGISNFYGEKNFELNRHVFLALRAHECFKEEKEYKVTKEGEVVLLDKTSGRMLPGVKIRGGQHQALESKEKVKISQETRSVASITYQNLFLLFDKMAGMSGTIADSKDELFEVYNKKVVVIPPNFPLQRKDLPDLAFTNAKSQFLQAVSKTVQLHNTGQPVLVVCSTISDTEIASKLLLNMNIPHNVLNANNVFWEAQIIKEAGQMGAVTVATSMAGRGTDIKLGEGVRELGGLAVIGIGRMINVREERQARGRSGRQGDPGSSQFFISLEDDIVEDNGADYSQFIDGKKRISNNRLKRMINSAQSIGNELKVQSRKQSVQYDHVMRFQRNLIYKTRSNLLDGISISRNQVMDIFEKNIDLFIAEGNHTPDEISRYILDNICYKLGNNFASVNYKDFDVKYYLMSIVKKELEYQKLRLGSEDQLGNFMRIAILEAIDDAWVEQVDYLQQLTSAVSGRQIAQKNPVFEYLTEASLSFHEMEKTIYKNIMRNILLSDVSFGKDGELQMILP